MLGYDWSKPRKCDDVLARKSTVHEEIIFFSRQNISRFLMSNVQFWNKLTTDVKWGSAGKRK